MSDAYEQIRNLLGTYCERMDAGDFAGLAELFVHARLADENGAYQSIQRPIASLTR